MRRIDETDCQAERYFPQTQVDRMEKQLQHLTDSAMSYKSIYAKSAAQMAREAMEVIQYSSCESQSVSLHAFYQACEQEAASSKKVGLDFDDSSNNGWGRWKMMRMSHLGFIVKHKHNGCVK